MELIADPRIAAAMEALSAARAAFHEAAEAGLILGNDNHIGDIGEYWVKAYFEMQDRFKSYSQVKNDNYDLELTDGTRVSVKTLTAWSKRGKGTQVKPLCGTNWQLLAAVLLDKHLYPQKIALVPLADLMQRAVFKTNAANRAGRQTRTYPAFQWWPWLDELLVYPMKTSVGGEYDRHADLASVSR